MDEIRNILTQMKARRGCLTAFYHRTGVKPYILSKILTGETLHPRPENYVPLVMGIMTSLDLLNDYRVTYDVRLIKQMLAKLLGCKMDDLEHILALSHVLKHKDIIQKDLINLILSAIKAAHTTLPPPTTQPQNLTPKNNKSII